MANVTAQEQLLLELVNRARMDPLAEAARYGIDLNSGIAPGSITGTPKQALAASDFLDSAARAHSAWMNVNDIFSHNEVMGTSGFTGVDPSARMTAAGYAGAVASGENISFTGGLPGPIDLTAAVLAQHRDLFLSTSGHRQNLLNDSWREIGVGQNHGSFTTGGQTYDASMITENFATKNASHFLTGVIFNDTVVADAFYSVGEGVGGIAVNASGSLGTSSAAGGYEIALPSNNYTVAIGGATVVLAVGALNVKLDLVNGNQVWSDTSLTLVSGTHEAHLLGASNANLSGTDTGDVLIGNAGNNVLAGNGGADYMSGGAGNDVYSVDSLQDVVAEGTNQGLDQVYSLAHYTLGANLEALTLVGVDINGAGNGLDNYLYGSSGTNIIDGGAGNDQIFGFGGNDVLIGGAGNDGMIGGAGDDYYFVDSAGDVVVENPGEGTNDTVETLVTYWLSANVETLRLGGTGNINGTGTGAFNYMLGNAGNNGINGGGAADYIVGGGGNDTIVLQKGMTQGDVIVDFAGNGAATGDVLLLVGWGAGAFLTFLGNGNWLVQSSLGNEYFSLANGATLDASDFVFA